MLTLATKIIVGVLDLTIAVCMVIFCVEMVVRSAYYCMKRMHLTRADYFRAKWMSDAAEEAKKEANQ